MNKYGISEIDRKISQTKIDKQRNYLSSQGFMTSNGEFKTFLDVSMSANLSSRYYAQLVNKVNTLQQVMTNEGLIPVFITATLDGAYHDLFYGNYERFTLYHQKKLPENDKNGYLKTKASNREFFTPRDLYQILRFQTSAFRGSNIYKDIKKDNNIGYLCSTEPHKSGVPHMHILLYIPEHSKESLLKQFKYSFWAPQGHKQSRKRLSPTQIKNGEINGFQWTLSNAVGYVMKYCMKSFMDIKNQTEVDELQAWYIKNKIIRISTSHTLVPQWVYNKVYPLESDWLYLSDLKLNSYCEWSKEDDYFEFTDSKKDSVLKYERGLYQQYLNGTLIREFGEYKELKIESPTNDRIKLSMLKKTPYVPIKIVISGIERNFYKKPISKRGDYDLITYYNSLDIETCNFQHFGLVQNELVKRSLISESIESVNNFTCNIVDKKVDSYDFQIKKAIFYHNVKRINFKPVRSFLNSLEPIKNFKIGA